MYPTRVIDAKKIGDLEISKSNSLITITSPPTKEEIKRVKDYNKKRGQTVLQPHRMTIATSYYNPIPGCCSGVILHRMMIPNSMSGKSLTLAKRAEYLKLLMNEFSYNAILMYVVRSDNELISKVLSKAGWKKLRGPVGRYSPYDYTLDTYTVDPRTPKKKLPPLKPTEKKKVVMRELANG